MNLYKIDMCLVIILIGIIVNLIVYNELRKGVSVKFVETRGDVLMLIICVAIPYMFAVPVLVFLGTVKFMDWLFKEL